MKKIIKGKKPVSSFEANGNKYHIKKISDSITAARYFAYEALKFEYSFDASPEMVAAQIAKAHNIVNALIVGKPAPNDANALDAITILYGLVQTLNKPSHITHSRARYMMLICTLFIVREDEDMTKWDEELAAEKVQDWTEEGLNISDFFTLGISAALELNKALIQSMENG
jgi:hypothetical protein